MWRSRTFWRLFAACGTLVLGAIAATGALVIHRVGQQEERQTEERLRTKAVLLREIVRGRPRSDAPTLQRQVQALDAEVGARLTLLAADGGVIAESEKDPALLENHADRPEVVQARAAGVGTAVRFSATLGQPMMYHALRTDDPAGAVAYVRVAVPLTQVEAQLRELRGLVWTAAGVTGLVALALAFWLARQITRPLQELTEQAGRIAAGDFGRKVYPPPRDEVGQLADAFNDMSARLADQFAQLEADRQQLRAILSGMVEGVVALDADQRLLFANDRAAELLDFQPHEAVGRKVWEVFRQRPLQDAVRQALEGPEPCQQEFSWNGAVARSLTVHAARLAGPPARGAVLVVHDTSELRRLERVRQEFVANVSHELKTPLAVIQACVETLLDGAVDDAANRGTFLEQIAEQSQRLHALILDLISLGRIESGAETYELGPVPLGEVAAGCVERHRARAEANRQALEAVPPADDAAAPVVAWADEEAVGHILENLVDNALKYTPEGGRIRVRWWAEPDHACLEVADTGIGIAERDLPRVFERFYRVDRARSRELGGTGLGLSIVKHLAQALHGSVGAASRLGHGSTFTVRLPRPPAS